MSHQEDLDGSPTEGGIVMLHDISHGPPTGSEPDAPASSEQLARQQAIRQIERRRRFWISTAMGTLAMALLVVIWAINEYHNAGGWPTQGFSQSSGIPNEWNYWIIYPFIAWVLGTAGYAWWVYGHRPISETEIKHEIERQGGPQRLPGPGVSALHRPSGPHSAA
jgi:hypothetical protein